MNVYNAEIHYKTIEYIIVCADSENDARMIVEYRFGEDAEVFLDKVNTVSHDVLIQGIDDKKEK